MSRRSFLSIFIVTTCIFSSIYAQKAGLAEKPYHIISQSADELSITFEFENPLIRKGITADHPGIIEISHLSLNDANGKPLLPVTVLPLALPDGDISSDVQTDHSESFFGIYPNSFPDQAIFSYFIQSNSDRDKFENGSDNDGSGVANGV